MFIHICFLLLCFFTTSQQLKPIKMPMPRVVASDAEFAQNIGAVMNIMSQFVLANDVGAYTSVKIGVMEHFNGTGYWTPQGFGGDLSIFNRNQSHKKIEAMIDSVKKELAAKNRTLVKRNVAPFDFGDQMLIFLAHDIVDPKKK